MNISSEEAYRRAVDALGDRMREVLLRVPAELQGQVNEIRLRQDRPLMLDCRGRKIFLNDRPLRPVFLPDDSCITVREEDLELAFRRLCDYSVHSHQRSDSRRVHHDCGRPPRRNLRHGGDGKRPGDGGARRHGD